MTFVDGSLIFLFVILLYSLLVLILKKTGIIDKYEIKLWGPALLLRTKKGIKFLKRISNKVRFWKAYGNFAIFFCFIAMILMTFLLIWQAWTLLGFTPQQRAELPGPEVALILPGINPILPLEYIGYIIFALVVAIIAHEFSHGILTLAGKLKVRSMGILYLIVPIGAFVEPDEEELKKTKTAKRMRVYAVGPLANFVIVLVTVMLFSFVFMSAVQPIEPVKEGITVFDVIKGSPADDLGITKRSVILSINGTNLSEYNTFDDRLSAYSKAVDKTSSNDSVEISYYCEGEYYSKNITLGNKYNYTGVASDSGIGATGIYSFIPVEHHLDILKNPFTTEFPRGFLFFYVLPLTGYFQGYNPIVSPFTEFYKITGPLGVLPSGVFWGIINALYWIFWLNLAVGLFNVLPMIPLDGGFLFNDAVGLAVKKFKKDISQETKEKIVKNVSLVVSLCILIAIIFPFFVKYI